MKSNLKVGWFESTAAYQLTNEGDMNKLEFVYAGEKFDPTFNDVDDEQFFVFVDDGGYRNLAQRVNEESFNIIARNFQPHANVEDNVDPDMPIEYILPIVVHIKY